MLAAGAGRGSYPVMSLMNYNNNGHFHWYNGSMNLMGVTNHFLIEFEALATGRNACLVLQIWPRTLNCGT